MTKSPIQIAEELRNTINENIRLCGDFFDGMIWKINLKKQFKKPSPYAEHNHSGSNQVIRIKSAITEICRRERMTLYSEVVDTPEHARAFLKLNKIKQKDVKAVVVLWEEEEDRKWPI